MPDVFTKAKRSQVMSAIRSRGNKDTELKFATILRDAHVTGWRRHRAIQGKPDFVFSCERLAVFVDGCFWHGCPRHGHKPGTNRRYWLAKLARNRRRDIEVTAGLRRRRWTVLRFWEHQLSNPAAIVAKIRRALSKKQRSREQGRSGKRPSAH